MRRVISAFFAVMLGLVATLVTSTAASAVDARTFDPGNIISDALFYDDDAMTAGAVQDFLDRRVPRCTIGDQGKPAGGTYYFPQGGSVKLATHCLRDGRYTSNSMLSNRYCSAYVGRANESAAEIITKIGNACGISQKVLLVMLEKEQSLIQDTFPAQHQLDRAMGYACPDSGPNNSANCDTRYYGFFNQVYYAAWQLKVYQGNPNSFAYKANQSSKIQWNPNAGCGTSDVFIQNAATAGLYIYTPYRPNQAALNAGWGLGDSCSAYGNRNFYLLYSTWFGPTHGFHVAPNSGIGTKYYSLGGENGPLGSPTGNEVCGIKESGCYQEFQRGAITWTPAGGAWPTWGGIRERWRATGFENGLLGYPMGDEVCGLRDSGCYQNFQNGAITWTAGVGAWETSGSFRSVWRNSGFENGPLKYPTSAVVTGLPNGGSYQAFQGGAVVSHPSAGTWATWGGIRAAWQRTGFESGVLGYPLGSEICGLRSNGCYQNFQGGAITWTPETGGIETFGAIRGVWAQVRFENGPLGYPITSAVCGDGICLQSFQNGTIVQEQTSSRVFAVWGGVHSAWSSVGGVAGALGKPTSMELPVEDGAVRQTFERGEIRWNRGHSEILVSLP